MKLSSRTQYGLRILLHIAEESQYGRLAQGKEIAMKQGINEPYLEQIMISLRKAGFVRTVRGRNGGYRLGTDPREISVLDIINISEGKPHLISTSSGVMSSNNDIGNVAEQVWVELLEILRAEAAKTTLDMILDRKRVEQPEYII